ncbi:hypothetical protein GE09DRAFT_1065627 [Coniochaeta sp. 2T2.1]|nr:hypothetical protein GE09DRAFT_1065627 [Coniochaeta sp. 2T2.1]
MTSSIKATTPSIGVECKYNFPFLSISQTPGHAAVLTVSSHLQQNKQPTMFTTFKSPPLTMASAMQREPSYYAPADPPHHRRTLKNVLPKRGFQYLGQPFDDIPTRNAVLDALRGANDMVNNIVPAVVDGMTEDLVVHLSAHAGLLGVVGYSRVFCMLQKQKVVPWIAGAAMTPELVDHLVAYMVKGRLRFIAAASKGANTPETDVDKIKKNDFVLSKTALAIDKYVEQLEKVGLDQRIPTIEHDDKSASQARVGDLTAGCWEETLARAKMESEAMYQRAVAKKNTAVQDAASITEGRDSKHGTKGSSQGTKRALPDDDDNKGREVNVMEQLTSDMALLRFNPNLRPVRDIKRRLLDFHTMHRSATKVVVEEMESITAGLGGLSVEDDGDDGAGREGPTAGEGENSVPRGEQGGGGGPGSEQVGRQGGEQGTGGVKDAMAHDELGGGSVSEQVGEHQGTGEGGDSVAHDEQGVEHV